MRVEKVCECCNESTSLFEPCGNTTPPLPCTPCCQPKQIVQYINLIKSDDEPQSHGDSFTTSDGRQQFPWLPADEFEYDYKAGHGTHTAGSVAGATLNNPAELVECGAGEMVSCVGGCIDDNPLVTDDDLVSYYAQYADIDRLCPLSPEFGCDVAEDELCLGDDVSQTLTDNGGMARGAKLAIFDAFYGDFGLMTLIGNDLWETCAEADCKLHSNSWGSDNECELGTSDLLYDEFMYEVIWHAWIFVRLFGAVTEFEGHQLTQ